MDLKVICYDVEVIHLAQDTEQCWVLMETVMNFVIKIRVENVSTS
jgi:hypothetical protein